MAAVSSPRYISKGNLRILKSGSPDAVARRYNRVQGKLCPLARGVFALMRRNGTLTALDAQRSPLGINSGSFTRRVSELRAVGFSIATTDHRDDVTGRRYRKYRIGGVEDMNSPTNK